MYIDKKYITGVILILIGVVACDFQHPVKDPIVDDSLRQQISQEIQGYKLKDLAGQTHLPRYYIDEREQLRLSREALAYTGRYKVVMNCEDEFVACEQGTADFILNLLPNGKAHRTIIYTGTITFESGSQHRQDSWRYLPEQQQIVLQRASGVEFFYNISPEGHLIVNRQKTAVATSTNRQYFAQGNPMPAHDYVFEKIVR